MHVVRNNDILHISVWVCPSKMIQRKFVEVIQSHFKSIILFPLRGNSLTENIIFYKASSYYVLENARQSIGCISRRVMSLIHSF